MADSTHQGLTKDPEPTSTVDDIYNWAIHSPYSPLNLEHLRQPRLQGAPRHQAGDFTFHDVFEDLLTATSGRPQASVAELLRRKAWETEPTRNVFQWVRELGVQGLWGSYFHLSPELRNRFDWMPTSRNLMRHEWVRYRTRPAFRFYSPWDREDRVGGDLFRVLANFISPEMLRTIREWPEEEVGRVFDEVLQREWRGREDAETEEDLYRYVHDLPDGPRAQERGDRGYRKGGELVKENTAQTPARMEDGKPDVTTTVYADGSKHVQTTERRESDGKTEVTTTSQHFDPQGNLVAESRESSTTRTWSGRLPGGSSFSWSWDKHNRTDSGKGEGSEGDEDGGEKKRGKTGWFWGR